jgi:hypothetical protein
MEIKKNGHEIVVIGTYAPTDDSRVDSKEEYFNKLTTVLATINKKKEIWILGDLNARTGKSSNSEIIGRYGEDILNDNGQRLIDFCEAHSLKILNGFFPHKNIHKFTWTQPTRNLKSIIDYFIQRKDSKLKTKDVKVFRGPECGSDHHMIIAKVMVTFKREQSSHKNDEVTDIGTTIENIKYNLESFKQDSTKFLYKIRIAQKIKNIETKDLDPESLYEVIKKYIHEAANEALGKVENRKKGKPEWLSTELEEKVLKKKQAYHIWLQSKDPQDREIYAKWNREVKKDVDKAKNINWEAKCDELDRFMGGTKVAQAWKTLKQFRKNEKNEDNISLIKLNEWEEYYTKLLKDNRVQMGKDKGINRQQRRKTGNPYNNII